MNRCQKLDILDRLIFIRGKYLKLEFMLKLDDEDATTIEDATARLAGRIEDIRTQLHDRWSGSANRTTAELRKISRRLQKVIRTIDTETDVAESILKAVGYVDDVLRITGRILGV